ncbi:MAG: hypothetical protein WC401_09915 [Bacteroidales bacterium]|jgi:hypothetical protein
MSRISGKINLMQLHAIRKMISGTAGPVECLVIPIEKNKLFVGEKGVYLDLVAFEIDPAKRNIESNDSHLLKQSFSKEIRQLMSDKELKDMPILGSLRVWNDHMSSESISSNTVQDEKDPLPF